MPTNVSSTTALLSVAEFVKRADVVRVGQLCSDTSTAVTAGALTSDPNLAAALIDAQGLLESFCLRGGYYTAADLAALTGASQGMLYRFLARLTFCLLHERKPLGGREPPWFYEATMKDLEAIGEGARLFGLQDQVDAGVMQISVDNRNIVDDTRGTTASTLGRFFGTRMSRRLP